MKRMQKKQAGFTILEIGIVMIILVSLVVAFSSGLWEKQQASEFQLIKMWFTKSVNESVANCRLKFGTRLQHIGDAAATETNLVGCGLSSETYYGENWDVTVPSTTTGVTSISFTYQLAGMVDYATNGGFLATIIKEEGGASILAASFNGTTLTVQVRVH